MQALRLSEEQQEKLLVMRQNHLNQLKQVYIQRQALNLKVCHWLTLPRWFCRDCWRAKRTALWED